MTMMLPNQDAADPVAYTTLVLYAGFFGFNFLLFQFTYYRYFHPLARYPGPPLASFTNLWKVYQLWTLKMPDSLVRIHQAYGEVVRVGPNDLSFSSSAAIDPIYKAGRSMPKTKFYDGFTTFNPNLFGTQDDEIHAIRRRQMAHAFSLQSIKDMEQYIDKHLLKLRHNLDTYSETGEVFDLKELIAFFVLDVLGELAFSRSFDSQTEKQPDKLPPINQHIYLACLMGMMPEWIPTLKKVAQWTPIPWLRDLFRARKQLKDLTAECVTQRLRGKVTDRKDLLTSLIKAVDPDTGARLTELDVNTEAFAMIVAGSHTTSGTLTLLFSHLLQNQAILERVVAEIDAKLSHVTENVNPVDGLEQDLPYTMACIQENFRINPVFTMPLPRVVATKGGAEICGHLVPENTTVFCLNHVVHHDPLIWGSDHDTFKPSRFLGANADDFKRKLTPFSIGHRMCIGRNMAMTNILKVLTTVLKHYELEMENPKKKISTISVGISEKEGPLDCKIRKRHSKVGVKE